VRRGLVILAVILACIAYIRSRGVLPKVLGGHSATRVINIAGAIAYAEAQIGKPYLYGATGPDSFDCSGLVYRAYGLPWSQRTSEEQYASERHVRTPKPGDLVFFTGSPIDPPPGHVGIVVGSHKMIDAYGAGTAVRVESFGLTRSAPGLGDPVGYTQP